MTAVYLSAILWAICLFAHQNKKIVVAHENNKCRVVINELSPSHGTQEEAIFAELTRVCGPTARPPSSTNLNGYVFLLLKLDDDLQIILSANLNSKYLVRKVERNDEGSQVENFYFVIGTDTTPNVHLNIKDQDSVRYTAFPSNYESFPSETSKPIAAVLLYFQQADRDLIKLFMIGRKSVEPDAITPDEVMLRFMKHYIEDLFVYSRECTDRHTELLKTIYKDFPTCQDFIVSFGDNELGHVGLSYSRCSVGNLAFQSSSFKDSLNTPGSKNNCPFSSPNYPFSLQGISLQTTAQKLILNVWASLKHAQANPGFLNGNTLEVSSNLLGIHQNTISKINRRLRNSDIMTPGKIRNRKCYKQIRIDTFDKDTIRSIISDSYKKGTPPYLDLIHTEFMKCKVSGISNQNELHDRYGGIMTRDSSFTISKNTFSIVLRKMGFKYGTINKRAVVLMKPEIVAWRGRHLRRIRKNDDSKEMEVVYLDETWVDPNVRANKGWVLKAPRTMADAAMYSYSSTTKIGRGGRLIVLAACDKDGIIKESAWVYKIKPGATTDDYHDNVNRETFIKWFKERVLDILDQREKKSLIVIDNAPYHSTMVAPKSNSLKRALYDWLESVQNKPGVVVNLRDFKQMRRDELWEQVKVVKHLPSMQKELYEIDQLTAARGHEILRLPPYNCELNPIEFAWKDVKIAISKTNLNQNIDSMKTSVEKELENYNQETWSRHWQHIKNLQKKYWDDDKHYDMDSVPRSVLISIQQEDDEEDEDFDFEYEEEVRNRPRLRRTMIEEDFTGELTLPEDLGDDIIDEPPNNPEQVTFTAGAGTPSTATNVDDCPQPKRSKRQCDKVLEF